MRGCETCSLPELVNYAKWILGFLAVPCLSYVDERRDFFCLLHRNSCVFDPVFLRGFVSIVTLPAKALVLPIRDDSVPLSLTFDPVSEPCYYVRPTIEEIIDVNASCLTFAPGLVGLPVCRVYVFFY